MRRSAPSHTPACTRAPGGRAPLDDPAHGRVAVGARGDQRGRGGVGEVEVAERGAVGRHQRRHRDALAGLDEEQPGPRRRWWPGPAAGRPRRRRARRDAHPPGDHPASRGGGSHRGGHQAVGLGGLERRGQDRLARDDARQPGRLRRVVPELDQRQRPGDQRRHQRHRGDVAAGLLEHQQQLEQPVPGPAVLPRARRPPRIPASASDCHSVTVEHRRAGCLELGEAARGSRGRRGSSRARSRSAFCSSDQRKSMGAVSLSAAGAACRGRTPRSGRAGPRSPRPRRSGSASRGRRVPAIPRRAVSAESRRSRPALPITSSSSP